LPLMLRLRVLRPSAQVKFYQYAGSLKIIRETSAGITDAQPNLSEPIRGWQDFTALLAHVSGTVNADLSASVTVTYANGLHVSASFAPAAGTPVGALLLLGNSNRSNGPHILNNIKIGSPVLERVGSFAQVASGGGWKTTMALVNPSATEVAAPHRLLRKRRQAADLAARLNTAPGFEHNKFFPHLRGSSECIGHH